MSSHKELLEESRDFWQESAKYDKKQLLASFVVAATGITCAGIGIGTMIGGDLASGALEIALGAGLAAPWTIMGIDEIEVFAETTARAAIRQNQIDEITET